MQRIAQRPPVFRTRLLIPEHGEPYHAITGVDWECPPHAIDQAACIIEGGFRAAHPDQIAAALLRLRTLTRSREEASFADREAEATIWIEQLLTWPGDIVLDVLKSWTSRRNGQFWPTWHEIQTELQNRTARRKTLLHLIRRLVERGPPPPAVEQQPESQEQRDQAVARWEGMRESFREPEAAPAVKETPEQAIARICGISIEEARIKLNATISASEYRVRPPAPR